MWISNINWHERSTGNDVSGPLFLPSSASTQFNSISTSIEAELVLFPFDPATHPPAGKVSIETGDESNQKGLIQDHLVTTSS